MTAQQLLETLVELTNTGGEANEPVQLTTFDGREFGILGLEIDEDTNVILINLEAY